MALRTGAGSGRHVLGRVMYGEGPFPSPNLLVINYLIIAMATARLRGPAVDLKVQVLRQYCRVIVLVG